MFPTQLSPVFLRLDQLGRGAPGSGRRTEYSQEQLDYNHRGLIRQQLGLGSNHWQLTLHEPIEHRPHVTYEIGIRLHRRVV